MENQSSDAIDLQNVKKQFDDILVKHIRRLLEVDTLAASLSFNLSTIACLLLLVERENDIKRYPKSPPEKFTRETFLDELANIGVDIDDTLMVSFQALAQHEYVTIDKDNKYNAQITTFALVSFLDNLFPGMRGLSLVGYVLQMINEVISGRKGLQQALDQFDGMLMLKGIPLSKQSLDKSQEETIRKPVQRVVKRPETTRISEEFKKALDTKLSKLRTISSDKKAASRVIGSSDLMGKTKIKEVFPKGPTEEEIKAREAMEKAEQEAKEREAREEAEKAAQEAKEREAREAAEKAAREAEKKAAELAAKEAEIRAAEIAAREAEMKAKEAEIKAREAEIAAREAEKAKEAEAEQAEQEKEPPKKDIEKQIAAFQEQIATACPICHSGKIISDTTEKGQMYFSCTNENCGFISWGNPHSFICPVCSNPFLIEFITQEGTPGLKCPKATCSFRQSYIGPPSIDRGISDRPPQQKRRKLIRRVKRK